MTEKFIEDLVAEQQRIADTIVKLKSEIKQVHDSVGDKEVKIQELAGKLDVLKQVHDFYTKGAIQQEQPQQQPPQEQQPQQLPPQEQQPQQQEQQLPPQQVEPEPQSVFNPEQQERRCAPRILLPLFSYSPQSCSASTSLCLHPPDLRRQMLAPLLTTREHGLPYLSQHFSKHRHIVGSVAEPWLHRGAALPVDGGVVARLASPTAG